MVRIDPCHGSDPGSIPGSFVLAFPDLFIFSPRRLDVACTRTTYVVCNGERRAQDYLCLHISTNSTADRFGSVCFIRTKEVGTLFSVC